ncbi:MAG: chlorite dismutase family protein [Cytophagales bacterium]
MDINSSTLFCFVAGNSGEWTILSIQTQKGSQTLNSAYMISVLPANNLYNDYTWKLNGFTSNIRYAEKKEIEELKSVQEDLGRLDSKRSAIIPIKKNAEWWSLGQDERRKIFEEDSHHTAIGLKYLPAIARKLYHSRDLGEPFDFITRFEYAEKDSQAFEDLVGKLRETIEWTYITDEIDIRLSKH